MEAKKVIEQESKYRPMMVDFLLPESDKDQGENPIVDSLAVVGEWTIVAKCALHGLIYMWDLKTTTNSLTEDTKKDKIIEKEVTMLSNLKWSDTDNFYMNLGCQKVMLLYIPICGVHVDVKGVGLVVCGDDKGSLWLYNMPSMIKVNETIKTGILNINRL